jgi:zinc transporter, ZIP family
MLPFVEFVALSAVMGLSIFLALPIVLHPRARGRGATVLSAAAIGILLFILADIFGNVLPLLASPAAFQTQWEPDAVFLVAVLAAFLALVAIERPRDKPRSNAPAYTALVIAIGIGFQNLTEGLVFGSVWPAQETGLLAVIFVGFVLQNITEGLPIASPFLATGERPVRLLVWLFLLAGIPTILGAGLGYFANSASLDLAFDGLAIGSIAYVLLPMTKGAFRPAATPEATARKERLVYLGVLLGFAVGFLVNAF